MLNPDSSNQPETRDTHNAPPFEGEAMAIYEPTSACESDPGRRDVRPGRSDRRVDRDGMAGESDPGRPGQDVNGPQPGAEADPPEAFDEGRAILPMFVWPRMKCPNCKASERSLKVYRTKACELDVTLRYMRCEGCGFKFKLVTDPHWSRVLTTDGRHAIVRTVR